nr:TPA_asm: hypothetical protein HUJ06_018670 [Nelumbo nucifera]
MMGFLGLGSTDCPSFHNYHHKVSIQIFNLSPRMGQEFWCIGFHGVQDEGMTILWANQRIGWANYD